MNKFRFTIKLMAIAIFMFAFASMAQAQASRTWVSGVGDDVNPCSRTAPCKTFAGAISKTAAGGEINCLDPGGFGAVTITKSMTIDGTHGGGFGSILASSANGVIVNAAGIIVTLRNLSINGGPPTFPGINGVRFIQGSKLNIEGCQIFNFTTAGAGQGAGIEVSMTTSGGNVNVLNTDIFNCTRGMRITTTTGFVTAVFTGSTIKNCPTGIVVETNGHVTFNNSVATFCTTGINMTGGATTSANLINSLISHNTTGLINTNATSRLGGCTFVENGTGITMTVNQAVKTFGNNNIADTITGGTMGLIQQL